MTFYILIIPVLMSSILMIANLYRMRKRDKVLYKFCQIRREIMTVLGEGNVKLPRAEYIELRTLLEEANSATHHFADYKPFHFNMRRNVQYRCRTRASAAR